MKQKNYFLSKVNKQLFIFLIDIDNILDTNAEKMFLQNISGNLKSNNSSSKSSKSINKKQKSKLSDFLKNGFLDYSLDSNSAISKDEQVNQNDEKNKKHKKSKNFVLKSELFSSFESNKKMKSERVSPRPSVLW